MQCSYKDLFDHCKDLGIELLTGVDSYDPCSKAPVYVRLGCIHKCVTAKLPCQVLSLCSKDCPMCCDGIQGAMELVETQLMQHHLTIPQIQKLNEDYHTIACLYALTKHVPRTIVSDMVEQWFRQEGTCAKCKCTLYPTLSTRSVHVWRNKLFCKAC